MSTKTEKNAKSVDVLAYMKKRKVTSTQEVATKFGIRFSQATANIAILSLMKVIERQDIPKNSEDQSSRWSCI